MVSLLEQAVFNSNDNPSPYVKACQRLTRAKKIIALPCRLRYRVGLKGITEHVPHFL